MTPRTIVFRIPDRDLEALVTILDDGVTLAFRPEHGSWGKPIQAKSDSNDIGATSDLDRFMDALPREPESATVYDLNVKTCPLCGEDLARTWDDYAPRLCLGCGARIRQGLVSPEEVS
jgi:hypothetical protein